jgi:hypothetical protein
MSSAIFSAADARIAGDFRVFDLTDAQVVLAEDPVIAIHVALLSIHGMPPWAHASTLSAYWRALVLVLAAMAAAVFGAHAVLQGAARTRLGALVLGGAGPLGALGVMRWLERSGARPLGFVLVPLAAAGLAIAIGAAMSRLHAAALGASK